jgi:hypothetical protein
MAQQAFATSTTMHTNHDHETSHTSWYAKF